MKMHSLHDLLADQLKDLYSAENQIIKALPRMAKAATHGELRAAFEEHLEQTRHHAERLEEAFAQLDMAPKSKKCHAIEGLVEEARELMGQDVDPDVLDAGLIAAAQKVEHYEMAGYGCCRTWAEQLGLHEVARLLEETLNEEKQTDQKLTNLAESMVNWEAQAAAGEEEMVGAGAGSRGMGNRRNRSRR